MKKKDNVKLIFQKLRDEYHQAIRIGNTSKACNMLEMNGEGARILALGKNTSGRCSLHIAVLRENESIVRYIAKNHPETLNIGDNVSYQLHVHLHYMYTNIYYCLMIDFVYSLKGLLFIMRWEYNQWKF